MGAYVNQLNAAVANQDQTRRDEKERVAADAARDRLTPLEDRLVRLLTTVPIGLQREGLSLPTLQASLRGRWRGRAHPGDVGRALRALGFTRTLRWRGQEGFQALWCKQG
jgi:hypothetical protein